MKTLVLLAILLSVSTSFVRAQGGIGVKPRTDLVMVGAEERDSLATEALTRIQDLKRYAETGDQDSAALIIAHKGTKDDQYIWSRPVSVSEPLEKDYVAAVLGKIGKVSKSYPELHP